MSALRDHRAERAWLIEAERAGGASAFAGQTLLRLDAGETAYGDRWAKLSLGRLIDELAEEAADLGAWGVLALQALRRHEFRDEPAAAALATRLHGAIVAGARAHRDLELARTDLRRLYPASGPGQRFTPDVDGRCINCDRTYSAHPRLLCPAAANRTEHS